MLGNSVCVKKSKCEFIKFVGLPNSLNICLGPDESELNANTPSMLVESLQGRRATGRHTILSAVPAGLTPLEHFREGLSAASPLDSEPQVPHDIEFALQKLKELGSNIHEWRLNQLKLLKDFLSKHNTWERELSVDRSFSSLRCSSHVSISANLTAAAIIGWPDDKLQALLQEGAKPMGPSLCLVFTVVKKLKLL